MADPITPAVSHSYGVSIYFPARNVSLLYANLDFTQDSSWDEFLAAYRNAIRR